MIMFSLNYPNWGCRCRDCRCGGPLKTPSFPEKMGEPWGAKELRIEVYPMIHYPYRPYMVVQSPHVPVIINSPTQKIIPPERSWMNCVFFEAKRTVSNSIMVYMVECKPQMQGVATCSTYGWLLVAFSAGCAIDTPEGDEVWKPKTISPSSCNHG